VLGTRARGEHDGPVPLGGELVDVGVHREIVVVAVRFVLVGPGVGEDLGLDAAVERASFTKEVREIVGAFAEYLSW
jgi:hypothetical protein